MASVKKTNAVRILENAKIQFELIGYEVDESSLSAEDAAMKTGVPEEQTFKTLCARGDKTGIMMVCLPAGRELDFKALSSASGNKSTELVPLKDVQPLTGYVRGGCSPLGMKKKYRTFIDETAILHETVYVSAGVRGTQLVLAPESLVSSADATVCDLALA